MLLTPSVCVFILKCLKHQETLSQSFATTGSHQATLPARCGSPARLISKFHRRYVALFMKSWGSTWQKLTTVFFMLLFFFIIIILLQELLVVYSQELSQDGKKLRKPIQLNHS